MFKKYRKIIILIITFIAICIGVVVGLFLMNKKHPDMDKGKENTTSMDATIMDATPLEQTATSADSLGDATATDADAQEVLAENTTQEEEQEETIPPKASLELELVYQYPELPTGCESVALTMLLKYYGFDLEKTTIASDYLIYSTNFVEGYMGNPFTTGGAGIYSPGLTRTANKFLDAQGSELNAKNVTDSTPEELYKYIAEGKPVVIWNTVYFLNNQPTGLTVKWGEKFYVWDSCEHCMVLSGYDLEKNVVIVHDPIEGIVERDAEGFWERYEKLGSMALIIR